MSGPGGLAQVVDALKRARRHADGNVVGQSYGFNAFSPIVVGEERATQRHLEELPLGADGPLARLGQLHCSRLHVLGELVYQGAPQQPEPLRSGYLIFTASFDGELDQFLDDICAQMPVEADAIWGRCVGYPGTADPAAFMGYMKDCQIGNHYYLGAYPDATVQDVRAGLALRRRMADFAARSQGMDAASLRATFLDTFGGRGS